MKRMLLPRLGLALLLILVSLVAGFTVWAYTPLGPMPEAQSALLSGAGVSVAQDQWIVFRPATGEVDTGLVFYPGGRVDARSYAPPARALAERGYLVVIVPMPFNLAVFGVGRAEQVIGAFPEIDHWAVGGHSLGGAMAASYLYSNPGTPIAGLVLWGSYPAENQDLSGRSLNVLSVFGSEEGGAAEMRAAAVRLPSAAVFQSIEGGNHAQFGSYGPQPGDSEARIPRDQQQGEAVEATAALLGSLSNTAP